MDDICEYLKKINIPIPTHRGLNLHVGNDQSETVGESAPAREKNSRKIVKSHTVTTVIAEPGTAAIAEPGTAAIAEPGTAAIAGRLNTPSLEDFAAKVLPPMKVVRDAGELKNIDSGLRIICPREHIFIQPFTKIGEYSITCPTCSQPGAITRRIREQLEYIFGAPFCLVKKHKTYIQYKCGVDQSTDRGTDRSTDRGTDTSSDTIINLITVKSGYNGETPKGRTIVLPESQSKILINESIYKQCADWNVSHSAREKLNALLPKEPVVYMPRLPYSRDFANEYPACRIIPGDVLYIENCGRIALNLRAHASTHSHTHITAPVKSLEKK